MSNCSILSDWSFLTRIVQFLPALFLSNFVRICPALFNFVQFVNFLIFLIFSREQIETFLSLIRNKFALDNFT